VKPAAVDMPWSTGPWIRVVDLSAGTRLPTTSRRAQAEALVRIFCPAEKAAPAEPTVVAETDAQRRIRETDAQRRIRQARQAAAGWT